MDFMAQLNAEQRAAVQQGDGPVLIVAGPGTGKTKTLTVRIASIIAEEKARPEQILALTFTKKAAEEMQSRVQLLLKQIGKTGNGAPVVSTFHALCHELLGGELHFASEPQRLQIIKQLQKPAELKGLSRRELGLLISRAKNMAEEDDPALAKVVAEYNAALGELGLVDFDDLLVHTRDLLTKDEVARTAVQQRFRYILVDEFQDTNRLQYELLQLLRGTENLFVIGDPLQSIYGFRGASGGIFEQFRADFPNAVAVTLTTNYRSVPQVVALSNALFADAPDLTAHAKTGGQVRAVQVLNEYSEAAWVLYEIQKAIGGGDMLRAVSDDDAVLHRTLRDFAIIYRNRSAAVAVQKAVAESGLPYQVVGDGSPYEQPQVLAIMALLQSALTSEPAALEGFTRTQTKAVQELLGQTDGVLPHLLADKIVTILGFEKSPAVQQFVGSLVRFKTLEAAVKHLEAIAETRFYDPSADAITLLTIHASKGLEFSHVFLVGVEEGILPHSRADVAEEKRLFYVAVTRAKERLDILHTMRRASAPAELSRFVSGLKPSLLPRETDPNLMADQRRAQKRAALKSQQSLF
jgi:DNA helicase-2/ATP-dependent DNA helicase PcrA